MDRECFVIQKFDRGHYDKLYDEIFDPAIRKADLLPYRVDRDPSASIPIETIEQKISESSACLAEISEDNPNVWFELGFAIACEKPLCLVCAATREKFPFDVQHRQIIRYPIHPLPTDYESLKGSITARLVAAISKGESLRKNVDAAKTLSLAPSSDGLRPHELLALTIIFQYHYEDGVTIWILTKDMEKGGYTKPAAALALTGLKRKSFVETRETFDGNGNRFDSWFVTELGEEWLVNNQHKLNLGLPPVQDEDIPF
ncbi:MAG: hypothetical protein ACRD5M_07780 [Candidatus Acidiferrales bacterium]